MSTLKTHSWEKVEEWEIENNLPWTEWVEVLKEILLKRKFISKKILLPNEEKLTYLKTFKMQSKSQIVTDISDKLFKRQETKSIWLTMMDSTQTSTFIMTDIKHKHKWLFEMTKEVLEGQSSLTLTSFGTNDLKLDRLCSTMKIWENQFIMQLLLQINTVRNQLPEVKQWQKRTPISM